MVHIVELGERHIPDGVVVDRGYCESSLSTLPVICLSEVRSVHSGSEINVPAVQRVAGRTWEAVKNFFRGVFNFIENFLEYTKKVGDQMGMEEPRCLFPDEVNRVAKQAMDTLKQASPVDIQEFFIRFQVTYTGNDRKDFEAIVGVLLDKAEEFNKHYPSKEFERVVSKYEQTGVYQYSFIKELLDVIALLQKKKSE